MFAFHLAKLFCVMTIPTKNGKIIQESLAGHLHKAILYYLHQIFGKMHISGACLQHLATHSHMFLPLEFDPSGCVARPDARALNEIWLGCKLSC